MHVVMSYPLLVVHEHRTLDVSHNLLQGLLPLSQLPTSVRCVRCEVIATAVLACLLYCVFMVARCCCCF